MESIGELLARLDTDSTGDDGGSGAGGPGQLRPVMHGDGGAAMSAAADVRPALIGHLKDLHLPTVRECYEDTARRAERETLSYEQYLLEVISRECEQRRKSRVQRLLKDSALPLEKSLQNFRSEAVAGESGTAVADAAGRQLSGPERERFGVRQSWVGEEPSI